MDYTQKYSTEMLRLLLAVKASGYKYLALALGTNQREATVIIEKIDAMFDTEKNGCTPPRRGPVSELLTHLNQELPKLLNTATNNENDMEVRSVLHDHAQEIATILKKLLTEEGTFELFAPES